MSEDKTTKEFFADLPKDIEIFVNKSIEISDRIEDILKKKNITQRKFATLLGKEESEISKWLSGTHNFTLKTLAKIESVLGEEIFHIKHENTISTYLESIEESKSTLSSLTFTFFLLTEKIWERVNLTSHYDIMRKYLIAFNKPITYTTSDYTEIKISDFSEITTNN